LGSEPLITIGITCFREGDWLLECWESVLAQTDDRWEAVLVMDGGADERTREIFTALDHPKLRKYAFTENVGPYPARNKAFELTDTPYHFYLDGDDQLVPESVALMLEAFTRHPDAGFVYGDYEVFGIDNSHLWKWPVDPLPEEIPDKRPPGACVYVKAVWQQLGGFCLHFARGAGDCDFHLTLAESEIRGYHCGRVYYRYRENSEGVSRSRKKQLVMAELRELMVRRHPRIFADRNRRIRFLSYSYKIAACANYWSGDIRAATKWARKAIYYGSWSQRYLWAIMLAAYLPVSLEHRSRQYWQKKIDSKKLNSHTSTKGI